MHLNAVPVTFAHPAGTRAEADYGTVIGATCHLYPVCAFNFCALIFKLFAHIHHIQSYLI
jgi:hypothetical protein